MGGGVAVLGEVIMIVRGVMELGKHGSQSNEYSNDESTDKSSDESSDHSKQENNTYWHTHFLKEQTIHTQRVHTNKQPTFATFDSMTKCHSRLEAPCSSALRASSPPSAPPSAPSSPLSPPLSPPPSPLSPPASSRSWRGDSQRTTSSTSPPAILPYHHSTRKQLHSRAVSFARVHAARTHTTRVRLRILLATHLSVRFQQELIALAQLQVLPLQLGADVPRLLLGLHHYASAPPTSPTGLCDSTVALHLLDPNLVRLFHLVHETLRLLLPSLQLAPRILQLALQLGNLHLRRTQLPVTPRPPLPGSAAR